jgi:hypothetical protein
MEIFVVCNTGYEECEFLCAFSDMNKASDYVNRKWGQYDNIVIYKHLLDSKEHGEKVHEQVTTQVRNWRCN